MVLKSAIGISTVTVVLVLWCRGGKSGVDFGVE